jgi:carbamoyl-phosphate synthase large subunit
MNSPKTTLLFLDKLNTYQFLTSSGIAAPFTTELPLAQASQLPIIVKPRSGSGSKAITVVRDGVTLADLQATLGGTAVAQSFLEGEDNEFTCAMVRVESEVRTLVMRRQLLGGLTTRIKVEYIPEIEAMLRSVSDAIGSYLAVNVQLRMTEHGPRIFEINPRFSSTVMMRHCIGFQDLAWVCDMRAGVNVPPLNRIPEGTQVFRRYKEVIQQA